MKTIKINTAELSGPALDWAVAKAANVELCFDHPGNDLRILVYEGIAATWAPSRNWSQGGPLIDRFHISVVGIDREHTLFFANAFYDGETFDLCAKGEGPTRLVAAMRAIVALKMGDTVDVPAELVETAP